MHDHMMDTTEAPKLLLKEGVNGAHVITNVITTTHDTATLNPKVVQVTPPISQSTHHHVTSAFTPNHVASLPPPPRVAGFLAPSSGTQTLRTPPPTFLSASPITQIQVARTTENMVQNPIAENISAMQKSTQTSNHIPTTHNHLNHVPNNLEQSTRVLSQPPAILSQPDAPNPEIGAFGRPQTLSVITSPTGASSSIIQALPNPVQTPTTKSISHEHQHQYLHQNHQHHPSGPTRQDDTTVPRQQIQSSGNSQPSSIHQASEPSENATKDKRNEKKTPQEDSSDTDMEIMSLDLTSRVNIIEGEKERERPMSWEGELSELDTVKNGPQTQEEQMRVEATEEPMSPMSPGSPCSENDQEPLQTQIKSEDALDAHSTFQSQTLPQTDSPVPARSDSGCELHLGPFTPTQSPLLPRIHPHPHSPTHLYSPTQSPSQSIHLSGFSSPYSHSSSTGLSRNNSDASQYGGSYNSYSSAPSPIPPIHYSPSQSPNLGRVVGPFPGSGSSHGGHFGSPIDLREVHGHGVIPEGSKEVKEDERLPADLAQHSVLAAQSGITRQQLINSPCPICGDKISGFHYGIFSCESCKGFFKRTVQNKKHYVCMRGSSCPVTIATRKKCPACRFDKCLRKGMKLEAIREDRTRGGRSTYQCAPYTLPPSLVSPSSSGVSLDQARISDGASVKSEPHDGEDVKPSSSREKPPIPSLLQQICDVEHLWHCSEAEMSQIRQADAMAQEAMENDAADCASLCKMAEGRLYKIVKWCKSLPLFRHISIEDQIILLMNSWCELLLLSCCFRSMDSPGEIRVSTGRTMSLAQAEAMGIGPCIERMLNLSFQLRRLQVDSYEYMAMKVIVLLTSDVAGLKEGEKVRHSQEKVVQALQEYTLSKYPHLPSKFGELLLRIPELQRTCHASKEMLSVKKKEGDVPSFNFLFDLLRGDL